MSVLNKTSSLLFYRIILIPFRRRIFQFDVCVCDVLSSSNVSNKQNNKRRLFRRLKTVRQGRPKAQMCRKRWNNEDGASLKARRVNSFTVQFKTATGYRFYYYTTMTRGKTGRGGRNNTQHRRGKKNDQIKIHRLYHVFASNLTPSRNSGKTVQRGIPH